MLLMANTFDIKRPMFRWTPVFLFALAMVLFATSCAKGPPVDEHPDKNTNAGKPNQPEQSGAAPYLQPTLKGDIERISLTLSMARDAAKLSKWQDAVSMLQGSRKEVDTALSRNPRLSDEFEALKSAIDRTIPVLENRGKDADARLAELQTSIGAIRVNSFAQ